MAGALPLPYATTASPPHFLHPVNPLLLSIHRIIRGGTWQIMGEAWLGRVKARLKGVKVGV